MAALSLVPWIALLVHPKRQAAEALPEEADRGQLRHAVRSPLAWSLAVVFAMPGFNSYAAFAWLPSILRDLAGVSPAEAGALLALYAAMGLPAGLIVPVVAARYGKVRLLVVVAIAALVVGYLGLLLVPTVATWLWVALAGTGPMLFPLALVLINLRTRNARGSGRALGVRAVGGLPASSRSGRCSSASCTSRPASWAWPLLLLLASAVPAAIAGAVVARPRYFEDERDA